MTAIKYIILGELGHLIIGLIIFVLWQRYFNKLLPKKWRRQLIMLGMVK